MNEVSLLDAWRLWFSGESIQQFSLWGMKILWWGRIGEVIVFVASLTVIADVVGPERLRKFGSQLHTIFSANMALSLSRRIWQWSLEYLRYSWYFLQGKESNGPDTTLLPGCLHIVLSHAFTGILIYYIWSHDFTLWMIILIVCPSLLLIILFLSPLASVIFVISLALAGVLLDTIFIEPFARLLEIKEVDRWLKVISVLLILIGFHFDLLAS